MQQGSLGKGELVISPQAMTNSATVTANLDCRGAAYASLAICFGIEKNTNGEGPTISLLESDDTVVSNFATFDTNFEVTGALDDLVAAMFRYYHVDLLTRKRYLRLSLTTGGDTNDDITACAFATLTRLATKPQNTTEMVATTNDVAVVG